MIFEVDSLEEKLTKLHEMSEQNPRRGCRSRAEELANYAQDLGFQNVKLVRLEGSVFVPGYLEDPALIPSSVRIPGGWSHHYVVRVENAILDPSIGAKSK